MADESNRGKSGGGGGGGRGDEGETREQVLARWAHGMRDVMESNSLRVLDLFRQYDRNDDGTISRKEFRDTMKSIHLPMSKKDLKTVIHALDENHDNKINYKEFHSIFVKYGKPKRKVCSPFQAGPEMEGESEREKRQGEKERESKNGRTKTHAYVECAVIRAHACVRSATFAYFRLLTVPLASIDSHCLRFPLHFCHQRISRKPAAQAKEVECLRL